MYQALLYRESKDLLCLSALVLLLFSSYRSTRQFVSLLPEEYIARMFRSSASGYRNIRHVRQYEFVHRDVPVVFNGCKLAFIPGLHYGSLLERGGPEDIARLLNDLHPDALLVGDDPHEGCEYVPDVTAAPGAMKAPLGAYIILGNNDYRACHDDILKEAEQQGIHLLGHKADTLRRNGEHIVTAGIRNPFGIRQNEQSSTLSLAPEDFVVLLAHTPDYAKDVPTTDTGLVLVGHMRDGQVAMFGLYVLIVSSHYGQRFLTELEYNSDNTPIIITNGIGTSNKNVRLFVPSKVAAITLLPHP